MVDSKKIASFEDLHVWQESQELAVLVYDITKQFPKEEMFGMISQIKRAATSVSANIAEGFGRSTRNDKLHFLHIAYGSLLETKNFLYLAHRLKYLDEPTLELSLAKVVSCQKLLNATKRSISS